MTHTSSKQRRETGIPPVGIARDIHEQRVEEFRDKQARDMQRVVDTENKIAKEEGVTPKAQTK